MRKRTLSLLIPIALFAAGAATAASENEVRIYDRTADGDGPIAIEGLDRDYYDLDGDGFTDMVVSRRAAMPLHATLAAVSDADWEDDARTMTGSAIKDAAVKMGVATREAAAVAATDRPGERLNPALESRTLHAQTEGQVPDRDAEIDFSSDEVLYSDAQLVGVAVVPVQQRVVPTGVVVHDDRIDVVGVTQRTADLDGDGDADLLLTARSDLEMQAALDAMAKAERDQRAVAGELDGD